MRKTKKNEEGWEKDGEGCGGGMLDRGEEKVLGRPSDSEECVAWCQKMSRGLNLHIRRKNSSFGTAHASTASDEEPQRSVCKSSVYSHATLGPTHSPLKSSYWRPVRPVSLRNHRPYNRPETVWESV